MDDLDDLDSPELRRLNALYLVSELERAIERSGIGWTAEDKANILDRLTKISRVLSQGCAVDGMRAEGRDGR